MVKNLSSLIIVNDERIRRGCKPAWFQNHVAQIASSSVDTTPEVLTQTLS